MRGIGSSLTITRRESSYLALIDQTGRPRFDVSPLWADGNAFQKLVSDIRAHFVDTQYDLIVALDALGFVLGGAIANAEGKGLVTVRKGGKLPLEDHRKVSVTFEDHDGEKTMEIRRDLVKANTRILLVDEWIGTGAQIKNVTAMLEEKLGANVVGIAVAYCYPDHPGAMDIARTRNLFAANCLICAYFLCQCEGQNSDKKE